MRKLLLLIVTAICCYSSFAQIDSAFIAHIKSLDTADVLKMDTTKVPNDKLTQKIRELRKMRGGLTIETIVKLKLSEEQQKDTMHTKEFYKKLETEITTGYTAKLLDNSIINLYRRTFTESEINELIRFNKTSAGKKMNKEYIALLVESVKNAEPLLKMAAARIELKEKKKVKPGL